MKKTITMTLTLGICGLILSNMGPSFAAEPETSAKTKGVVTFTDSQDKAGDLVKPNENDPDGSKEEIIKVPEGSSGMGNLRIQFVPNFDFGTIEGFTPALIAGQPAKVLAYQDKDGKPTGKNVPAFVQVTNNTGDNVNKWRLTAKATTFKEVDSSGNYLPSGHELTSAYISLNESTLTTTRGTTQDANDLVFKQADAKIPTDGTSALNVMEAKAGTNGKQISNVFKKEYKESDVLADNSTDSGVTFVKPAGETPQKTNYKSEITWTLTDGI